MSCHIHHKHDHQHGPNCGHTGIQHGDHIDYLHDGHLHHPHGDHVCEHVIEVSERNPEVCQPAKACGCVAGCACDCDGNCGCGCHEQGVSGCHDPAHVHGPDCGHEAIPHGDHVDYVVNGRLHHPHGDHCDDHGPVTIIKD